MGTARVAEPPPRAQGPPCRRAAPQLRHRLAIGHAFPLRRHRALALARCTLLRPLPAV